MKFWEDKEKIIILVILALGLALVLGIFIGRLSAHNVYYLG